MAPEEPARRGPIRLTIVDDNPFLRASDGTVRPRAATFHRFAEAVAGHGPFGRVRYVVPVRDLEHGADDDAAGGLNAVDASRLEVVASAPFDGAAGYLAHLPSIWRHNLPLFRRSMRGEHLVWIKVPGSNGVAAALAAEALGVPRFTYVVGSVREVIAASPRSGLERIAASGAASLHDGTTAILARTAPILRLGPELFTSAVSDTDLPDGSDARGDGDDVREGEPWHITWAGRVAPEKGLGTLLRAVTLLRATGHEVRLTLIGDGPERPRLEAQATTLGISDSVDWTGHLGDRHEFRARLAAGHIFVLPSLTEGVPKVVVEAMAWGLPVVASAVGGIPALLDGGRRGGLGPAGDEMALAAAIRSLMGDPDHRRRLRREGMAWAADHTTERQATRLVDWMRATFPALPWPGAA